MELFEWLIGLTGVSLLLASVARRLQVPYPSLLALGGAGLAFIPGGADLVGRWGFHPPRPMVPPTVKAGLLSSW